MKSILESQKARYLMAGGWNTAFGYFCGVGLFYGFGGRMHVVTIGVIANILAISMAFFTYKVFVFRTKGNWLLEYLKTYVVYGATAIIGVLMLWLFVDGIGMPFWFAQGFVIAITVAVSFVGHSRFTFKAG